MKARLAPAFFKPGRTDKFDRQLNALKENLSERVEWLEAFSLGDPVPECEAVVFPEIIGEAYRKAEAFQSIDVPILIITSEFSTVSMWDWEIIDFLRGKGVKTIAPYNQDQALFICRALSVKRSMRNTKFLVFQDDPGEGFQPAIFKSFYWWEQECIAGLKSRFGLTIEKRSLKALGARTSAISDDTARTEWKKRSYPTGSDFTEVMALHAMKLYLAINEEIDGDDSIGGVGTNCLNESRSCSTTPCLAWDILFEDKGLLWACEGDVQTLATKFLLYKSISAPIMMSNIYPFLMGMAALKHEGIPNFPEIIENPDDHLLLAHCGYFGLIPRSMSSNWELRAPVLGIVNEKSHMFNARFPIGEVTLAKMNASHNRISAIEGRLKGYVQYPGSDCRNGGIVEVPDGKKMVENVFSHHQLVMVGKHAEKIDLLRRIYGMKRE
ncbi:MAG: hypothetical protein KAJ98_05560 [Spirochaetaceae bacterium]|nr:hypothetical protein [Spirochaetaceae bacterium]